MVSFSSSGLILNGDPSISDGSMSQLSKESMAGSLLGIFYLSDELKSEITDRFTYS